MQCNDLELDLHGVGYQGYTLYFIWLELYHNNLTHGGYVIGGGTGELPPKDMKFRYLGFVTCWWASSYIFVICYLVGECCFQTYISTQPLLELSAHLFKSFLQGFGNVIAPANISTVCWLFGMSFHLNEMARQQRMIERELMRWKSYPYSYT